MSKEYRSLSECSLNKLRELTGPTGPIAARWCAACDKHYRFCHCTVPAWKLRTNGVLGPMPGEPGGPETLADMMDRRLR